MAYSYTERKRIRKSFGNRESVLAVPYMLQMQKDAYTAFLQADRAPKARQVEGLQAAFDNAFPIVSHNGFVEMKYLEYNLAKPAFDVRECQTRGLTYASAVRAKVQARRMELKDPVTFRQHQDRLDAYDLALSAAAQRRACPANSAAVRDATSRPVSWGGVTRTICVVGTSYVGLSMAVLLARHHDVVAFDIDERRIEMLRHGRSPISDPDIEELMTTVRMHFFGEEQ